MPAIRHESDVGKKGLSIYSPVRQMGRNRQPETLPDPTARELVLERV